MLGTDFEVAAADRGKRVVDYLARVHDNGAFYGLLRGDAVRAALPMPNMLGADWAWVARLAFQGPIRVQPDTQLRRSYGGASTDVERIAEIMRLPPSVARHPMAITIAGVHRDILPGRRSTTPHAARPSPARAARGVDDRPHAPVEHLIEELQPVLRRPAVRRALVPVRGALGRLPSRPRPGRIVQRDRDAPPR